MKKIYNTPHIVVTDIIINQTICVSKGGWHNPEDPDPAPQRFTFY